MVWNYKVNWRLSVPITIRFGKKLYFGKDLGTLLEAPRFCH